jgi:cytochrome P450
MATQDPLPTLPFERPGLLGVPPQLLRLQAEGPITRVRTRTGDEAWLVTRYDEVRELFADPRLGRSHPQPERAARFSNSAFLGGPMGDAADEEQSHGQMRAMLTPLFSARRIQAMRPHVEDLVRGLLDAMERQGPPLDLHEHLSFPLPVLVICELLGVPFEDWDRFRGWSGGIADLNDRERSLTALRQLTDYMQELCRRKRTEPGDDVISTLIAEQGDRLGDRELAGLTGGLLFAGHETTVVRIDFGVLLLLTNPEQRGAIVRDPSLIPGAVEEILRLANSGSGGGGLPRYAHADIEIGGVTIRTGDAVMLSGGAANLDPRVFEAPEVFDAQRQPNAHLTFGYGARFCIGAGLARLELQTTFGQLLQRFRGLRLAVPIEQLRPRRDLLTGGLEGLPVAW